MKTKVVKIAISLPRDLLEAVDRECKARAESRSQFFQHAVDTFIRQAREREAVGRYIQGYREQPETDEEVAAVHQVSRAVLSQELWE